jgi:membrane-bound metal-dependent hydrolase YbcI (DUF457 family)
LFGWLVNKIERKRKKFEVATVGVAFLWGLLTHPLLDFFTTWMGNSCLAF